MLCVSTLALSGCGLSEDSVSNEVPSNDAPPENEDTPTEASLQNGESEKLELSAIIANPDTSPPSVSDSQFGKVYSLSLKWEDTPYVQKYWLGVGTSKKAVSRSPWGDIFSSNMRKKTSAIIPIPQFDLEPEIVDSFLPNNILSITGDEDAGTVSMNRIALPREKFVYVRLWSKIKGKWRYQDSKYKIPNECMKNDPVCGEKSDCPVCEPGEPCSDMPCEVRKKTYRNICQLKEDGASFVHKGKCKKDDRECPVVCAGEIPVHPVDAADTAGNDFEDEGMPYFGNPFTTDACTAKKKGLHIIHYGECKNTGGIPENCLRWFDGCNTCSRTDSGNVCTLMACTGQREEARCLEHEDDEGEDHEIPENCAVWFDGCNTCSRMDSGSFGCTRMACKKKQEAYCKKWFDQDNICDANRPCSDGKECYKFKDMNHPICFEGDPCRECASGQCVIAQSYPPQVHCIEEG